MTSGKSALQLVDLQLVEATPYHQEVALPEESARNGSHSLHQLFPSAQGILPEIVRRIVEKYSKKGDVVLDPFAGSGTVLLEAGLRGRRVIGFDRDELACRIAEARLAPADLGEVALGLQIINLRRPIDLSAFTSDFGLFYDVDTFCELLNLRQLLSNRHDRVSRFVELLALSILHGHTTSYLSVYTSPRAALGPVAQSQLNRKREQVPDFRSVTPRILKKAAFVLRDGAPASLTSSERAGCVICGDARNLSGVGTGSIPLIVTKPPTPVGASNPELTSWLRRWFVGAAAPEVAHQTSTSRGGWESWRDYMNESLVESARVVRHGGRCALVIDDSVPANRCSSILEEITSLAGRDLSRFWSVEGRLTFSAHAQQGQIGVKSTRRTGDLSQCEVVLLRRR